MTQGKKKAGQTAFAIVVLIVLVLLAFRPWRLGGDKETTGGGDLLTCQVTIDCSDVLDHFDLLDPEKMDLIPEDGMLLSAQEVSFSADSSMSVLEALQEVCQGSGVALETNGQPAYVEGLGGLYNGDAGGQSGWTYSVNGQSPMVSAADCPVAAGDSTVWSFVCTWEQ